MFRLRCATLNTNGLFGIFQQHAGRQTWISRHETVNQAWHTAVKVRAYTLGLARIIVPEAVRDASASVKPE